MKIKFSEVATASGNIYRGHLLTPGKDSILVECDQGFVFAYFVDEKNTNDETWIRTGEGYQHKAGDLMDRYSTTFCAQVEKAIIEAAASI